MTRPAAAYSMTVEPILLKELTVRCNINQGDLAAHVGLARTTVNLVLNRGYIPTTIHDFRSKIETYLQSQPRVNEWLIHEGYRINDIWQPLGKKMHRAHPRNTWTRKTAIVAGDPTEVLSMEVEMLTQEARKHFKLFRDPFPGNGGVDKDSDIFMSDEHRYLEAIMLDAAKHGGLLAIIGQVGSGKSTIRKKVCEALKREGGVLVVFPQIVNKDLISSSALCDAIVMDISDEKPKIKHEQKARQVRNLLIERSRNGDRCCLIIEEAHNLTVHAFKTLKQLWEMEDGYNKLLSIILIGQTELGDKLDERHHPEMREIIRRIQTAHIQGLNGNMKDYLQLKFKRVGAKLEDIFSDEALDVLARRLTNRDERGKSVSYAYPLTVNMYAVNAINHACEMGSAKVTEKIVEAI